jgi:hypothetical protein|tara:strand:- start:10164 stop:10610 length:447 start_codon:yes stop_codon:yes gene_type:complete
MSVTHCKWLEDDEQLLINPDGQVLPCCYLSNYFAADKNPQVPEEHILHGKIKQEYINNNYDEVEDQLYHVELVNFEVSSEYLYKEYMKRKDELNIFKNDLEDIVNNEWFTSVLPASWQDPYKISLPCEKICTKGVTKSIKSKWKHANN